MLLFADSDSDYELGPNSEVSETDNDVSMLERKSNEEGSLEPEVERPARLETPLPLWEEYPPDDPLYSPVGSPTPSAEQREPTMPLLRAVPNSILPGTFVDLRRYNFIARFQKRLFISLTSYSIFPLFYAYCNSAICSADNIFLLVNFDL